MIFFGEDPWTPEELRPQPGFDEPPTVVEPVVITGRRLPTNDELWQGFVLRNKIELYYGDLDGNFVAAFPGGDPNRSHDRWDQPTVTVDVSNPSNQEAAEAAAVELRKHIARMDLLLDLLPDDAVISTPLGSIAAGEVKLIWRTMDWKVTDADYGVGRAGANDGVVAAVNFNAVNSYLANGQDGANFLMLHEIAHNTEESKFLLADTYEAYVTGHPGRPGEAARDWWTSPEFYETEAFANTIAKHFAEDILGVNTTMPAVTPHRYQQW